MSLQAMDWALRKVRGISPTQKLILICLANHAGPDGNCWPSQSVISEYTELSRETIYRNLSDLEKKGMIRSVHRYDDAGRDLSKTYFLNMTIQGETQSLTGMSNHQGGETQSLTTEIQDKTRNPGETENLTGETENLREGDGASHPGEIQNLTSKENLSKEESVIRTKRIKNTHVEVAGNAPSHSDATNASERTKPRRLSELAELWNKTCQYLPSVREMTHKRCQKEKLRLRERPDLTDWFKIFQILDRSSFCRGENRSGWKATFDWIIENQDNSIKVLEGKYSGTNGFSSKGNYDFDIEKWAREG